MGPSKTAALRISDPPGGVRTSLARRRSGRAVGAGRAALALRTSTVVLVESHRDTRELYAEYLRLCGFSVMEASTTDEALPHVAAADAVVTAISVHGSFDGLELIRRVRASEAAAATAIVVVTTHVFASDRVNALTAGADRFLEKPCPPDLLAKEIRRAIALGHVPRPRSAAARQRPRRKSDRAC